MRTAAITWTPGLMHRRAGGDGLDQRLVVATPAGVARAAAGLHGHGAADPGRPRWRVQQPCLRQVALGPAHRAGVGGPGAGPGGAAGVAGGRRRAGRVPGGRLARALRHRAGGGPPGRHDAAVDQPGRVAGAGLCQRRLGRPWALFPRHVPVPAHGLERRFRHRRPVQPVCLLRGAAHRVLRADGARAGRATLQGRPALRGAEPAGLGAVSDRGVLAVCAHRHPELR